MKNGLALSYIAGFLVVTASFVVGYFAPTTLDLASITKGAKVQLVGPFSELEMLNRAVNAVEDEVGTDVKLTVQQQARGDISEQYVVSIDGTIARTESPLKEYGYVITVDDGTKNPLATSVLEYKIPNKYYALVRENVDGGYDVKTYKLRE
jgi:hypothetical protein